MSRGFALLELAHLVVIGAAIGVAVIGTFGLGVALIAWAT